MRYPRLLSAAVMFLAMTLGLQAGLVVYKGKVKIKYEGGDDKGTVVRDVIIIRDLGEDEEDIDDDDFHVIAIDKKTKLFSVNNQITEAGAFQNDDGNKDFEMIQIDLEIEVKHVEGGVLELQADDDAITIGNLGKVKLTKEVKVEVAKVLKLTGQVELEDTSLSASPADHDIVGGGELKVNLRVHGGWTREANDPEGVDGDLDDARDALIDELEDNGYSSAEI